jgi:uncharacterized OB-fold protein
MSQPEYRVFEGTISLPYRWALGPVNTRFFEELKQKRIFGTKCPECTRVLVPARKFCPRCFVDTPEWVQVKDEGILRTWAFISYSYVAQPKEPPYITAVIDLDGADVGFSHYIGGVDFSDLEKIKARVRIGMRVCAVWKENREGRITDIEYFAPGQ